MRKLVWAVAVIAALTIAGCGGDDGGGGDGGGGDGGSSGGSASSSGQGGSLQLKQSGTLTVGAEFPVAGFVELPIDHPKGFEVDFADALAKQLGVPTVKWVNTPFSGLFSPAPKNFDVAINEITITPKRAEVVDFSDPYFDASQGFLINKGGPGEKATSIADMKNLQFGYQATTTGGDYIKNTIKPDKQPREYTTLGAATRALANGQIDAFLMDVAIGSKIVQQLPKDVAMPGQFQTGEQYGVLMQKGSSLRPKINAAIAKLKSSGKLAAMREKWFPGTQHLQTFS